MITAKQAKKLTKKAPSACNTLTQVHTWILIYSKLGFTNTSFYVPNRFVNKYTEVLEKAGYKLWINKDFSNSNRTLVDVEWWR